MNGHDSPRVRVLKAERADIEDRLSRAVPLSQAPQSAGEIHDRAAAAAEGKRMEDIAEEIEGLVESRPPGHADT
jgi:hypothetical protein